MKRNRLLVGFFEFALPLVGSGHCEVGILMRPLLVVVGGYEGNGLAGLAEGRLVGREEAGRRGGNFWYGYGWCREGFVWVRRGNGWVREINFFSGGYLWLDVVPRFLE